MLERDTMFWPLQEQDTRFGPMNTQKLEVDDLVRAIDPVPVRVSHQVMGWSGVVDVNTKMSRTSHIV